MPETVSGFLPGHDGKRDVMTEVRRLESARFVADKADLAKSEFLSSMSRELRTPLNALLGFSQLLESALPPPTAAETVRLQQIIKAGWFLMELINEILDLAVIESGKLSLSLEPVLLIDVMRECQVMIEPQAQQRGIPFDFVPFDTTWVAQADQTRIKQVLINLLSNAIKYNGAQGTVAVKCTASRPGYLRISIKDSGAGLPPDKLAQLFQPFNRLGQENGIEEGTDIGLVVTRQLAQLMGGALGVESTVGVESEFWSDLMQGVMPQRSAGGTLPAERAQPTDVILMDINLPGISGSQALKILRDDLATAHIPVIALSANAMQRDIENGLAAGFSRYLTKPIEVDTFMEALERVLALSETGIDGTMLPELV